MHIAIVCTDTRADLLARTLHAHAEGLSIYRWRNKLWDRWSSRTDTWELVGKATRPAMVDLLFLHKNDSLVGHQSTKAAYNKIALFSTPGISEVSPGVCPIRLAFPLDDCPLTPTDVAELLAWAGGQRAELPSISTRTSIGTPHLFALAILCQGYLAAHGGPGLDHWEDIDDAIKTRAQSQQSVVETSKWWLEALGLHRDEASRDVWVLQAKQEWRRLPRARAFPVSVHTLITTFGRGRIEPDIVLKAFGCLKEALP